MAGYPHGPAPPSEGGPPPLPFEAPPPLPSDQTPQQPPAAGWYGAPQQAYHAFATLPQQGGAYAPQYAYASMDPAAAAAAAYYQQAAAASYYQNYPVAGAVAPPGYAQPQYAAPQGYQQPSSQLQQPYQPAAVFWNGHQYVQAPQQPLAAPPAQWPQNQTPSSAQPPQGQQQAAPAQWSSASAATTASADIASRLQPLAVTVDALSLVNTNDRAARPAKIAVIVRGLPGSGKSRIAKALRDAEVASGGDPPRVLSLDDYFLAEVEKEVVEEGAGPGGRPRKRVERCMVYEYDAAMEPSYASQLLRSFRRAAEDPGAAQRFKFIVVDAPILTCRELATYLDVASGAGYDAYVAQPSDAEMDPRLCAERGTHGRSLEEVQSAAGKWEATPVSVTRLDMSRLLAAGAAPKASAASQGAGSSRGSAADDDMDWGAASPAAGPPPGARAGAGAGTGEHLQKPQGSRWAASEERDPSAAAASSSGRTGPERGGNTRASEGTGGVAGGVGSVGSGPPGPPASAAGGGGGAVGGGAQPQPRRKRKRKSVSWNEDGLELIRVPGLGPMPGDGEITPGGGAGGSSGDGGSGRGGRGGGGASSVPFWASHGSSGTAGPLAAAAEVGGPMFMHGGTFSQRVKAERRVARDSVGGEQGDALISDD